MSKSKEKILILLTDFITVNLAFIIFFTLRVQSGMFDLVIMPEFILPMLAIYFYWLIIFTFVGMYRTWFAASRFDELSTLFKATFVGIFILFFVIFLDDYVHDVASSTRILIFIYWGLLLVLVGSGRMIIRSVQRNLLIKGIGRRCALIIGFNEKAFEVFDTLEQHRGLGIDAEAFVAVNTDNTGKDYKGIKAEGSIENLEELISKYNVQEIIIALEKDNHDVLVEVISKTEGKGIKLKIVPDLYEILSGQARTSQIYGMPLIDIMPELMPEWEKKLKRLLDIVISFILLLISLPAVIISAIAIKLDSKGSVFFKQERSGMNGKSFKMVKFRSMYQDAEKLTGPVWSQKDDPRITKVGRIIRKLRIDEIPQMYNVLKGEMSLVGPRPERPFFVEKLSEQIPYYKRRLKVRPGITGWAQVKHKYDESIEDVKIKLRYDLFYIENMSIRMDMKILFRTIFVVIFGKGHYN
ncbi:MAG TPA: sugar transferase [Ignavibacteriaceae bacterium]|nr:sugar transferase [Ignavibacteriaceae bacterium]